MPSLTEKEFAAVISGRSKKANAELDIPARYQRMSFENFVDTDRQIHTMQKALLQKRGVYLHGDCGTGKTHVACALMLDWFANALRQSNEGKRQHPTSKFISTVNLLLKFKETFNTRSGEAELIRKYTSIELLLLDDIGAERATTWSKDTIITLVGLRDEDKRQTIFTSNLNLQAISESYDDRISSRIGGTCAVVKLAGPDRRLVPIPVQEKLAVND